MSSPAMTETALLHTAADKLREAPRDQVDELLVDWLENVAEILAFYRTAAAVKKRTKSDPYVYRALAVARAVLNREAP